MSAIATPDKPKGKKTTCVRMDDAMRIEVHEVADANGIDDSALIRMAVRRLLNQVRAGEPIEIKLAGGLK